MRLDSRGPDGIRTENSPRIGITGSLLHGFEPVVTETFDFESGWTPDFSSTTYMCRHFTFHAPKI